MGATSRRGLGLGLLAAVVATGGLGAVGVPAGADVPNGAVTRLSTEGPSSQPAIDDAGGTVAYIMGRAGHVMAGDRRVVADAMAREIDISANGAVVVFATPKSLAGADRNGLSDVYAVNRDGAGLRLVSAAAPDVAAYSPSLNHDGSTVAYSAGGASPGARREIFVRDGGGGAFKVSPPAGVACDCIRPSLTNSGNSLAFEVTDRGIFMWDRNAGTSKLPGSDKGSSMPSMSGNGAAVAYQRHERIVVHHRQQGTSVLVRTAGAAPSLSADGNVVAFQANGALANDANGRPDVAVYEVPSGRLQKVSAGAGGTSVDGGSYQPAVNADGGRVAFESDAAIAAGDVNGLTDVFLRVPADGSLATPPPAVDTGRPPAVDDPDIPGAYWLVASDGGVFSFAGLGLDPRFFGSTGNIKLNQPIVGAAAHTSGQGYWFVASDGGIFSFGASEFFGSTGAIRLNQPIVGMAATPSGKGYWLVASDGGIFTFGDAKFLGSTGAIKLNQPIVGMAATPSGNGYWLVASDGGIFTFGDAAFMGSTGAIKLNQPIVGMASRPRGDGYWLVASDGGVFSFGAAPFKGSTGAIKLNSPIVGMQPTRTGTGYWFTAADGGVFTFGDAGFFGSMGGTKLNRPIVGMAATGR